MYKQPTHSPRTLPCDLCGHVDFEIISDRDRRGKPLRTVICRCCGLISHEEIPGDEQLASYYRQRYRRDYHGEYVPSPHRVVREWGRGERLCQLLKSYLDPGNRVLEVGSGIGCTVKNFEAAGFQAEGVEPGRGFCEFSRNSLKAKVRCAVLADLPQRPVYDMIMMVHVLEHLNQPRAALEHLHAMLKPDGLLYVEVPDVGAPHAAPHRLFHFAHIYNFTASTLWMIASRCGFKVHRDLAPAIGHNVMLLLEKSDRCELDIPANSYEETLAAVRRYNRLTYVLRKGYLRRRIQRLGQQIRERITAQYRYQQILQLCQQGVVIQDAIPADLQRRAA